MTQRPAPPAATAAAAAHVAAQKAWINAAAAPRRPPSRRCVSLGWLGCAAGALLFAVKEARKPSCLNQHEQLHVLLTWLAACRADMQRARCSTCCPPCSTRTAPSRPSRPRWAWLAAGAHVCVPVGAWPRPPAEIANCRAGHVDTSCVASPLLALLATVPATPSPPHGLCGRSPLLAQLAAAPAHPRTRCRPCGTC